jgi:hypothetical protein
MTLMPETRVWEKQGVKITFLCYVTMLSLKVQNALREVYLYDAPTPENPQRQAVPVYVFAFYEAMPLIMSVELPDDAPLWGQILKRMIESPTWLSNPVADYKMIERTAPDQLLTNCYDGFKATRESAYIAPEEIRAGEPQHPQPDPVTGEVDQAALNFTQSSTPNGGAPLTVMPSPKQGARSQSNRQKAK